MNSQNFDLLIIGSGPGGHTAAFHAAKNGLTVGMIERKAIGGVCMNVGCIPSKAMIHKAALVNQIGELEHMGIAVEKSGFDFSKVYENTCQSVANLKKGIEFVVKKNKIEYIQGNGVITGVNTVKVGEIEYTAKNIIIATGSTPTSIPGVTPDHKMIIDSDDVFDVKELPKSLLVVGGGVIGVELGYVFNAFGSEVRIVEYLEQILPFEDKDTASTLARSLKKQGVKLSTSTKVLSLEVTKDGVKAEIENKKGVKEEIEASLALIATGRKPNISNIGLEGLGLETERGFVKVGDFCQTVVKNIYAIGDVISTPMLAHVAAREGIIAVDHILGKGVNKCVDAQLVPSAVYTEPQVGSFGKTEAKLQEEVVEYEKKQIQYRALGKAVATGELDGLIKILTDSNTKQILGVHCVGAQATEVIHSLLVAKTAGLGVDEVKKTIFAHPSFSEIISEALH
jgi:dihydrolipoamide dehydrogenase